MWTDVFPGKMLLFFQLFKRCANCFAMDKSFHAQKNVFPRPRILMKRFLSSRFSSQQELQPLDDVRAERAAIALSVADLHAASSGGCSSDVELGAVHRSAPRVRRWTGLSRNKNASLCCFSCAVCRLSLLSCQLVSCPGTQTVTNLVFFFAMASKSVDTT